MWPRWKIDVDLENTSKADANFPRIKITILFLNAEISGLSIGIFVQSYLNCLPSSNSSDSTLHFVMSKHGSILLNQYFVKCNSWSFSGLYLKRERFLLLNNSKQSSLDPVTQGIYFYLFTCPD